MKEYREINNPIEVMNSICCDRCGYTRSTQDSNWAERFGHYDFITIKRASGVANLYNQEVDCCPACWVNVVRPALEYAGFTFQESE